MKDAGHFERWVKKAAFQNTFVSFTTMMKVTSLEALLDAAACREAVKGYRSRWGVGVASIWHRSHRHLYLAHPTRLSLVPVLYAEKLRLEFLNIFEFALHSLLFYSLYMPLIYNVYYIRSYIMYVLYSKYVRISIVCTEHIRNTFYQV